MLESAACSPGPVALVPPGVVTVTLTVPVPDGEMAVIVPSPLDVKYADIYIYAHGGQKVTIEVGRASCYAYLS